MEEKRKAQESKNKIKNTIKYGEFVSSYHAWLTPEKQKSIAKKLENVTKK